MKKRRQCVLMMSLVVLMSAGVSFAAKSAIDYVKDDMSKEWCYLGKSTTVIGVPFTPMPVQVTYDGAVFNGANEICFFYGKEMTPSFIRQKTFYKGWMPMTQGYWTEDDLKYSLEAFSNIVAPLTNLNSVQFMRYEVENIGLTTKEAVITVAQRGSAEDFRKGRAPAYEIKEQFSMTEDGLYRDKKLVYLFSKGGKRFAIPNVPYTKVYTPKDSKLVTRGEAGLVTYTKMLKPGEKLTVHCVSPSVAVSDQATIKVLQNTDYNTEREKFIAYWTDLLESKTSFTVPEARVNNSIRAAMVHLLLATREKQGERRQGSGLPYDALFLNDYFDMCTAYDVFGLSNYVDYNTPWLLKKQHENGNFVDVHNRGRNDLPTSHCQAIHSLAHHYMMTGDKAYAREIYPALKKGVEFILKQHFGNENGLMADSYPYDNEMILGPYTSHNLLGILALRVSIVVAQDLGETEDAKAWKKGLASYEKDVLKAIDWTYKKRGYITPGLYDYTTGPESRKGFAEYQTGQDWENNLLVYPCEVLEMDDPKVAGTLQTIRDRKYREGVMTYRNGMHIHQYITINQAHQYMLCGDDKHALLDFYHVLLHNGSTHDGFENLVEPWSRKVQENCPPPHAWAAAKTALFGRNMMLVEHGGSAGLYPEKRNLYIFNLIGPTWIDAGKKLTIKNAPTEMGQVSAELKFVEGGAHMTLSPTWRRKPNRVIFRTPYFLELISAKGTGGAVSVQDGVVSMEPTVTSLQLKWREKAGAHDNNYQDILNSYRSEYGFIKIKQDEYNNLPKPTPFLSDDEKNYPATPLSFDLVKKAYHKEYNRRAEEVKKNPIVPPEILGQSRRERLYDVFLETATPDTASLTTGRPVTASVNKDTARRVVDGNTSGTSWDVNHKEGAPNATLMIELTDDLTKLPKVERVIISTQAGRGISFKFLLEGSNDGQRWQMLADYSKKGKRAPKNGYNIKFPSTQLRYIRLTLMGNNKNRASKIFEIAAYDR